MPAQEWKLRSLADQKKERKGIEIGKSWQYGLESGKIQTAAGKGRTGRSEISIEKGIFLIRFLKKKKEIAYIDFEKTIVEILFFLYNIGIHALGRK